MPGEAVYAVLVSFTASLFALSTTGNFGVSSSSASWVRRDSVSRPIHNQGPACSKFLIECLEFLPGLDVRRMARTSPVFFVLAFVKLS